MPSIEERQELERALQEALGEGPASTLMAGFDELGRLGDRIDALRAAMEAGFAGTNARLDRMDARLDGTDARLDGMEAGTNARLDGMDARLVGMDARLDGMNAKLDGMDAKFEGRLQHQFALYVATNIVTILAVLAAVRVG